MNHNSERFSFSRYFKQARHFLPKESPRSCQHYGNDNCHHVFDINANLSYFPS
ncbi:hypothetical protein RND71_000248 [Anisodus tanguticus]|uniref:Uncharacterized protein n=1 Tax=Anisodus tanguticus TaxID=243964 RepID=A0AAE1VV17_9SOLA|nr:hypothetical protein RND71_000248 [Anisodus tanguticus]